MKQKTNVEFITELMNFSEQGGLIQGFVLEGLRQYALQVRKQPASNYDSPLLNGEAWKACAEEYISKLDQHYTDRGIPEDYDEDDQ